jgi:hypothetical protein
MIPALGAFVVAASLAAAPELRKESNHRVSIGLAWISWALPLNAVDRLAAELAWSHSPQWLPKGVDLGAGLRVARQDAGAPLPLEGFVGLRLSAQFGAWEPAAGPQVGVSGLGHPPPRAGRLPTDIDELEADVSSPFFVSFDAAPARFRFARFTVSALELGLGSTIFGRGTATRVEVKLLQVGISL